MSPKKKEKPEVPVTTIRTKTKSVHVNGMYENWFLDYASYVILERAVPHINDGLKPVQRRVLYAMYSEGLVSSKKHSKCAGVVGEGHRRQLGRCARVGQQRDRLRLPRRLTASSSR